MRELLMRGLIMREKAFDQLGPLEADALLAVIRERLRARFGGRVGGTPRS